MSEVPQKLNVGEIINGAYEVLTDMGENELGQTCLVRNIMTMDKHLIKQLSFACDDACVSEISKAVSEFKKFSHKSLASLHEFFVVDKTGYVVMEYINGESFESHLVMRRERGQILGVKAAYSFLTHLCLGVDVIHHAGYAYGCLSPKTIFVTQQGRVRIANYICAWIANKFLSDDKRDAYFGSAFTAPEARASRDAVKPVADVYSLALLFAELLSNNPLSSFESSPETFIAALPNVSTVAKEALFQATKPDIEDRFHQVQQLKDSLKNAVDAPNDKDISSIVVGVNDLRALTVSSDMPVVETGSVTLRKPDLFDSPVSKPAARVVHSEVWIYQKDGMDYGPFDHKTIVEKLHQDIIDESTYFFNTQTKRRQNFGTIPEFADELSKWIPIRENNRIIQQAEQRKKEKMAKAGIGGIAFIIVGALAAVIAVPVIILALLPDPEPLNLAAAFPAFEKEFKLPKSEEVTINVGEDQAKALFNAKATQAELEAAYRKWEEENRRKRSYHRSAKGGIAGTAAGDGIETLVFTGEDGQELEPLMDWEVEAQLENPRFQHKVAQCVQNHAGGRTVDGHLQFTIQQTGSIINLSTSFNGELNKCIISAASSIKYRASGGTTKKVTLPISYR